MHAAATARTHHQQIRAKVGNRAQDGGHGVAASTSWQNVLRCGSRGSRDCGLGVSRRCAFLHVLRDMRDVHGGGVQQALFDESWACTIFAVAWSDSTRLSAALIAPADADDTSSASSTRR